MTKRSVTIIFKGLHYEFDLTYIHSLQNLIHTLQNQLPNLCSPFVLVHNPTNLNRQVNSTLFQQLVQNNKSFNLYVFENKRGELDVQRQFGRLQISQQNQLSEELQVSFTENQPEKIKQLSAKQQNSSQAAQMGVYRIQHKIINEQVPCQKYIKKHIKEQSTIGIDIQCDICFAYPIQGQVFKCLVCQNFDLCSSCEQHYHHFHPLLLINKQQHYPTSISITFEQQAEQYMRVKLAEEKATFTLIKKIVYQKDGTNSHQKQVDPALLASKQVKASNFIACMLESC